MTTDDRSPDAQGRATRLELLYENDGTVELRTFADPCHRPKELATFGLLAMLMVYLIYQAAFNHVATLWVPILFFSYRLPQIYHDYVNSRSTYRSIVNAEGVVIERVSPRGHLWRRFISRGRLNDIGLRLSRNGEHATIRFHAGLRSTTVPLRQIDNAEVVGAVDSLLEAVSALHQDKTDAGRGL